MISKKNRSLAFFT